MGSCPTDDTVEKEKMDIFLKKLKILEFMFFVTISFFKKINLIKEADYQIKKEKLLSFFFYTYVDIFEINIFYFVFLKFYHNKIYFIFSFCIFLMRFLFFLPLHNFHNLFHYNHHQYRQNLQI